MSGTGDRRPEPAEDGEKKAKAAPVPAIHVPMVMVCPEKFMT